jgi:hypothetical protein
VVAEHDDVDAGRERADDRVGERGAGLDVRLKDPSEAVEPLGEAFAGVGPDRERDRVDAMRVKDDALRKDRVQARFDRRAQRAWAEEKLGRPVRVGRARAQRLAHRRKIDRHEDVARQRLGEQGARRLDPHRAAFLHRRVPAGRLDQRRVGADPRRGPAQVIEVFWRFEGHGLTACVREFDRCAAPGAATGCGPRQRQRAGYSRPHRRPGSRRSSGFRT